VFQPGQVIYFNEFYFKNGNTAKPKYLIILGRFNDKVIVASLPTSKNNAPSLINTSHGCINIDDRLFNCYAFQPGCVICENGFSFALPTFIYGNQVEDYDIETLEAVYKIQGVDYEEMGVLKQSEYRAILDCIINSAATKRGIKRFFM
jgi:hypothetical protein